jgi:hypothetical protein
MTDFDTAFAEHQAEFLQTNDADVLNATGPFSIIGFRTTNGEKKSIEGRLYQTRANKVLVAVFPGVLCREPPRFGRLVLFSYGGPGSTVKIECFPEQLNGLLKVVAEIAQSYSTVQDASEYHGQFLKNIVGECSFNEGLIVPDLGPQAIVLTVSSADAEEHRQPPDQEEQQALKRQRTDDNSASASAQEEASAADDLPIELDSDQDKANAEVRDEETQHPIECMVCLDAPPSTLVLPCMHKVVCEACSEQLKGSSDRKTCLYCRSEIQGISYESGETFEL